MINLYANGWKIEAVKNVFFDKDGTLIDSHLYWGGIIEKRSKALISYLKLDKNMHPDICCCMGLDLKTGKLLPAGPIALLSREKVMEIVHHYLAQIKIAISISTMDELFKKVHKEFIEVIYQYIRILPGVNDLLQTLKNKRIKIALITTDSVVNTNKIIRYLNIENYFDIIIGKESTAKPKISGEPARLALAELKAETTETICIGDAPMDMIMSKEAGLSAGIGVALGQISAAELSKYSAYVINDYSELKVE